MPTIFISPHKNIAYTYLVLTGLLVLGLIWGLINTVYGAEILVTPQAEETDINFSVNAGSQQKTGNFISAEVIETTQEAVEKGAAKATVSMEDFAEGEIIITNNTRSSVTFIATTRFQSPNNLIYRLAKQVTIPARGKITGLIRAEKMGQVYEIGPSKFTVPNLKTPSLVKNILVESTKPITGGLKKTGIIMQADIDGVKNTLKEKLYNKGLDEIEKKLTKSNLKIVVKSDVLKEECDTKPGEEKAEFTVSEQIKISAVAFQEKDLLDLAVKNLKEKIPQGKELAAFEAGSLSARLTKCNTAQQEAGLDVQFRGYMIVNKDNQILDRNHFVNLTAKEIKNYFKDFKEIKEAKVKFWPFFLKKSPDVIEKIKITILSAKTSP